MIANSNSDIKKKKKQIKGAGIIILDYPAYMRACYEHLMTVKTLDDGQNKEYYSRADEIDLERTKSKIRSLIQEGLEEDVLTDEEYSAMLADDKDAAKFYCTFKVHKKA